MDKSFILKGNICQTKNPKELDLHEYASLPLYDYGDA